MNTQQFFLHIAFPEDTRLSGLALHNWQEDLSNMTDEEVHILAPLSLKTRKDLYERLKRLTNVPIVSILYPLSLPTYSELAKDNGSSSYGKMQPPVETIDCDEMHLAEGTASLFDELLEFRKANPRVDEHGTPHHKEAISEHIIMVAEKVVEISVTGQKGEHLDYIYPGYRSNDKFNDVNVLHTVALYHDLGKYWTKTFDEKTGYYRYPNHENVSAVIFVTEMLLKPGKYAFLDDLPLTDDNEAYCKPLDAYISFENYRKAFTKSVTQVILNHMFVKTDGYKPRAISRRNLSDYEQLMLSIFCQADDEGRKR